MFAVIKTGGKQYRVAAEDVLKIDRVEGEPGEIVQLGEVLVLGGDTPQLGAADGRRRHGRGRGGRSRAAAPRSSPSRSAGARIRGASAATGRNSRWSGSPKS